MNISKKNLCSFIKIKLKTDKVWALKALQYLYKQQDDTDERGVLVYVTLDYMNEFNVCVPEFLFEKKSEIDIPEKYIDRIRYVGTMLKNGVGFSKFDAKVLNSLHDFYAERKFLSEKQYALLFKKISKYYNQIYMISDKEKLKELYLKEIHCSFNSIPQTQNKPKI